MRSRLVIPAALIIAAAYLKGRWDARAESPDPTPDDWDLPLDAPPVLAARETAATTIAPLVPLPGMTELVASTLSRVERLLDAVAEWRLPPAAPQTHEPPPAGETPRAPDPDRPEPAWTPRPGEVERMLRPPVEIPRPDGRAVVESGSFSVGGWAAASGHTAFCGVTFPTSREVPVDAAAIRLIVDASNNVAEGGLVVLRDAGFAPDREGFTLALSAAGGGPFAAAGRYEVLAD